MRVDNTAFAELSLAKSKEPRYTIELAFQENAETGTAQTNEAYLLLDGTAVNYASTPDSASNSVTGDITLRAKIAPNDWSAAGHQVVVTKYAPGGFLFWLSSTGTIGLSVNGTTSIQSSTAVTFTDGAAGWIRATLDLDNGAGSYVARFYTSTDGETWTQLGTDRTGAAIASISDVSTPLSIGLGPVAGVGAFNGKIYYAEVCNGIAGPVVAKFDPLNDATHGAASFTSSTSEVWTINGTATIVGGTNGIKLASDESAVDDFYNDMVIELADGQRRTITDYVGETKIAAVAEDWTASPDAQTYRIDDLYYLTSHPQADSAIITSAPVIYDVIRNVSGTTQQLYPDEARATIGAMSFDVIDKSSGITSKVYTKLADGYGLKGKRARLYMGFDGLTFDEYEMKWTQIVDSVSFDSGAYEVQCADVNRSVRKEIFDLKVTNLSASIDAAQLLIPVYSVTGFTAVEHGTSYSDAPSSTVGYLKIDDEKIRWTSTTTDATLGLCFVADQRGALNTQAIAHTIDANAAQDRRTKVEEYVYLEMPAPKLAYAILTGTIYGQDATLPDNWHLGISTDYVRLADFTGIGSDWWDPTNDAVGFVGRAEGLTKQDAKAFLEKEVYLLLGAFSPIYADGALGLKRMTGVTSGAAYVMKLDTTNVVSHGALQHDMAKVMNNILIEWNWEDAEKRYTRSNLLIDSNSISTHGTSKLARLKFRLLHGSRHSYSALTNRFNVLRDRYAGPPLRLDVRVMPSLDVLEVGDIVRVNLSTVRDYSTGSTLDRAFEVQGVRTNWITGEVSLTLFGSSQAATVITPDSTGASQSGTATPPLSDAWYSSAGASLVTYLAANYPANYTDVGGILTITGDVTLPGNATISEAMAYYYAGDITINAGVTVSISHNLYLKVAGHITINGDIDGVGQGIAGSAAGTVGYIGTPEPAGGATIIALGILDTISGIRSDPPSVLTGALPMVPNIEAYTESGTLSGMPSDLRGTAGSKGGDVYRMILGVRTSVATGGNGGASGAGMLVVCRGMSFGVNGGIDLSGGAGTVGGSYTTGSVVTQTVYAGTGAGGAPGALVVLLDGAGANLPSLGTTLTQAHGSMAVQGTTMPAETIGASGLNVETLQIEFPATSYYTGISGYDMGQAAYRVQYLPENTAASEDVDQPLPDVTNFSAAPNGGVVVFKWTQVNDYRLAGYDIRYAALGVSDWDLATPLTRETKGTQVTSAALPPGSWTVLIKALSRDAIYSANPATQNITVVNVNDIIYNTEQAPDWLGSISADSTGDRLLLETGDSLLLEDGSYLMLETAQNTFVRHWTGVLVPNSQDLASADTVFDEFVPNPYTECLYTAPEIDTAFDADVRIWGDMSGYLGPGETGTVDFDLYVDHHTTAGSYDGFETWTIGEKTTRYVQHQLRVDTTIGVIAVESFIPVVDVKERTEHGTLVVAAGGSTLTFDEAFHVAPTVEVTAQGSTALIATHETPATTGVRLHVFNTGGSDIGGTVSYKITGA